MKQEMKRAFLFYDCGGGGAPRYVILGSSYKQVASALGGKYKPERIPGGVFHSIVFPENLSQRARERMKAGTQVKVLQYTRGLLSDKKRVNVSGGLPHLQEIPVLIVS